jgi:hypothetical protein
MAPIRLNTDVIAKNTNLVAIPTTIRIRMCGPLTIT